MSGIPVFPLSEPGYNQPQEYQLQALMLAIGFLTISVQIIHTSNSHYFNNTCKTIQSIEFFCACALLFLYKTWNMIRKQDDSSNYFIEIIYLNLVSVVLVPASFHKSFLRFIQIYKIVFIFHKPNSPLGRPEARPQLPHQLNKIIGLLSLPVVNTLAFLFVYAPLEVGYVLTLAFEIVEFTIFKHLVDTTRASLESIDGGQSSHIAHSLSRANEAARTNPSHTNQGNNEIMSAESASYSADFPDFFSLQFIDSSAISAESYDISKTLSSFAVSETPPGCARAYPNNQPLADLRDEQTKCNFCALLCVSTALITSLLKYHTFYQLPSLCWLLSAAALFGGTHALLPKILPKYDLLGSLFFFVSDPKNRDFLYFFAQTLQPVKEAYMHTLIRLATFFARHSRENFYDFQAVSLKDLTDICIVLEDILASCGRRRLWHMLRAAERDLFVATEHFRNIGKSTVFQISRSFAALKTRYNVPCTIEASVKSCFLLLLRITRLLMTECLYKNSGEVFALWKTELPYIRDRFTLTEHMIHWKTKFLFEQQTLERRNRSSGIPLSRSGTGVLPMLSSERMSLVSDSVHSLGSHSLPALGVDDLQREIWKHGIEGSNMVISLMVKLLGNPLVAASQRDFLQTVLTKLIIQQRAMRANKSGQKKVFFEGGQIAPQTSSYTGSFLSESGGGTASHSYKLHPTAMRSYATLPIPNRSAAGEDFTKIVSNFLEVTCSSRIVMPSSIAFKQSVNPNIFEDDSSLSFMSQSCSHQSLERFSPSSGKTYQTSPVSYSVKLAKNVIDEFPSPRTEKASSTSSCFAWDICIYCHNISKATTLSDVDPNSSSEASERDISHHLAFHNPRALEILARTRATRTDVSTSTSSIHALPSDSSSIQNRSTTNSFITPRAQAPRAPTPCIRSAESQTFSFMPNPSKPFASLLNRVFVDTFLLAELGVEPNAIARFLKLVECSFKCSNIRHWGISFYNRLNRFLENETPCLTSRSPRPNVPNTLSTDPAWLAELQVSERGSATAHASRDINIYHNCTHTAFTLQFLFLLLSAVVTDFPGLFSPTEIFSMLLATLSLDLFHSGFDDRLLINSLHPLAILYNDRRIQRMHAAHRGWSFVKEAGLLNSFSETNKALFRSLFMRLVLSVDDPLNSGTVRAMFSKGPKNSRHVSVAETPVLSALSTSQSDQRTDKAVPRNRPHPYQTPPALRFSSALGGLGHSAAAIESDQKETLMVTIVNLAACSDFMRPTKLSLERIERMTLECSKSAEMLTSLFPESTALKVQSRLNGFGPLRTMFVQTIIRSIVRPNIRDFRAFISLLHFSWHQDPQNVRTKAHKVSARNLHRKHAPSVTALVAEAEENMENTLWKLESVSDYGIQA
eukprot:gnl/Chilomastix_cuspidata/2963.p1 GENE.gnl/Chilomastix_cuspidata/2963~~gnl/Chilomastix_cuspidata/2963.p1  ORF type:complete len:1370 (-),score=228.73 gnl/Chilomastix_cuspidata/2963:69-4178(-)